uniref:Uncharacterized protein n=1 Tax=viral metagenome TaxID=1070528 RepID=A0A6M3JS02_9ZZZZ
MKGKFYIKAHRDDPEVFEVFTPTNNGKVIWAVILNDFIYDSETPDAHEIVRLLKDGEHFECSFTLERI